MKPSLFWVPVAAVRFALGANIRVAGAVGKDTPSVKTAPTAAEAAEANDAAKISNACLWLSKLLPGKVYGLNTTGYNTQSSSYFTEQEREVKPSCFVLPSDAFDVSIAIKALGSPLLEDTKESVPPGSAKSSRSGWVSWLFPSQESKNKGDVPGAGPRGPGAPEGSTEGTGKAKLKQWSDELPKFAIRSGGHTPWRESSNIQGGVTIDLSSLKQIDIAPDRSYVKIGPGNRWADVYSKLDAAGLATSGGRVATVGVGGLTTGGGISFFSREYGLVCDNVIEFEVVLADGIIVLANEWSHPELYRALKGGSGNFGIVTRINMKTFPFGLMWGGTIIHALSDDLSVRQKTFKYFEEFAGSTTDVHAAWIHSWSYTSGLWVGTSNVEYTLPSENTPPVFQPISGTDVEISFLTEVGPNSLTNLTIDLAALNPAGNRGLFATLTHKNSAEFMETFFQIAKDVASTVNTTAGLVWSISYQPLSHIMYSKSENSSGNSLGLANETEDLVIILLTASWSLAASDERIYDAAKELFTRGEAAAKKAGVYNSFKYLNYADKWQNPIAGYGEESVLRLREVAAVYDPLGLFQRQVPGGFKIPSALGGTGAAKPAPKVGPALDSAAASADSPSWLNSTSSGAATTPT